VEYDWDSIQLREHLLSLRGAHAVLCVEQRAACTVEGRFSWDTALVIAGIGVGGELDSRDWSAQGYKRTLGLQKAEDSVLLERQQQSTV